MSQGHVHIGHLTLLSLTQCSTQPCHPDLHHLASSDIVLVTWCCVDKQIVILQSCSNFDNAYLTVQAQSRKLSGMLMKMRCSLHAHKLALLLSSDTYNDDTPIIEAAACDVHLETQGRVPSQRPAQAHSQEKEHSQGQLQQLAGEHAMFFS